MLDRELMLGRRRFMAQVLAGAAVLKSQLADSATQAAEAPAGEVFLEKAAEGKPHIGKVLLAVQAHSDDIPLMAPGTVAKLVKEGYTG